LEKEEGSQYDLEALGSNPSSAEGARIQRNPKITLIRNLAAAKTIQTFDYSEAHFLKERLFEKDYG
jgi:hypothetical protein